MTSSKNPKPFVLLSEMQIDEGEKLIDHVEKLSNKDHQHHISTLLRLHAMLMSINNKVVAHNKRESKVKPVTEEPATAEGKKKADKKKKEPESKVIQIEWNGKMMIVKKKMIDELWTQYHKELRYLSVYHAKRTTKRVNGEGASGFNTPHILKKEIVEFFQEAIKEDPTIFGSIESANGKKTNVSQWFSYFLTEKNKEITLKIKDVPQSINISHFYGVFSRSLLHSAISAYIRKKHLSRKEQVMKTNEEGVQRVASETFIVPDELMSAKFEKIFDFLEERSGTKRADPVRKRSGKLSSEFPQFDRNRFFNQGIASIVSACFEEKEVREREDVEKYGYLLKENRETDSTSSILYTVVFDLLNQTQTILKREKIEKKEEKSD